MSDRQRAVALRAQGMTYRAIGRHLDISHHTARLWALGTVPGSESEYDSMAAYEHRKANPAYDRDPVWIGMRPPGTP